MRVPLKQFDAPNTSCLTAHMNVAASLTSVAGRRASPGGVHLEPVEEAILGEVEEEAGVDGHVVNGVSGRR